MARRPRAGHVCAFITVLAGCGGGSDGDRTATKTAAPPRLATTTPSATYPDDVVGMVLLDAPLPDTFKYAGRYLPKDDLPKPGDWRDSPEKVDDLTTFRQAQALRGNEPKIPVTYLAAKVLDVPPSYPRAKLTAADRRLQRDYLARFAPGRLIVVDSPHYMEPEIPGRIAREVKRVVAASTTD